MHRSYEEIRETVHERILSGIDYSVELADEEILRLIDEETMRCAEEEQLTLSQMRTLRQEVFYSIRKLDVLQELVDDPGITEIMINGTENIFIERNGKTTRYARRFTSRQKLEDVIQQVVAGCNRVVNESSPIVDARLENGARVNVVMAPVALNGPIVTIRRFPDKPIGMSDLIRFGSLSEEIASFLKKLVAAGYNIFISGGTGSGKTTFLNALSDFIPEDERIITIEDNAELQILHIPNLVRLEARNANIEGCVPISIRDLIRSSLRMRPDRIIVGEVRGAEAIDMIQAMNTGHDGSMSTGHANSAADMLSRLETMILMGMDLPVPAIRGQLSSGIDLIIHLGRLRDGSRKLLELSEVRGMEDGRIRLCSLCSFEETEERHGKIFGTWKFKETLQNQEKLLRAGITL
ncbi:MAG: CpaF family protein [Lachnospiraceae bacterium]|nr:CpaF family protein [Lachnospiraceae bacterium]